MGQGNGNKSQHLLQARGGGILIPSSQPCLAAAAPDCVRVVCVCMVCVRVVCVWCVCTCGVCVHGVCHVGMWGVSEAAAGPAEGRVGGTTRRGPRSLAGGGVPAEHHAHRRPAPRLPLPRKRGRGRAGAAESMREAGGRLGLERC